jgi:hypothetical protein
MPRVRGKARQQGNRKRRNAVRFILKVSILCGFFAVLWFNVDVPEGPGERLKGRVTQSVVQLSRYSNTHARVTVDLENGQSLVLDDRSGNPPALGQSVYVLRERRRLSGLSVYVLER